MSLQIPQKCLGLAPLLRFNLAGEDLLPLGQALIQRATDNADDAASLLDAAIVLQIHGNMELAMSLQQEALRLCRHYWIPATGQPRLRLLVLMAPGELMVNVPIECLLVDSDIELHLFYLTGDGLDLREIPEHDVLFVALSETEANRPVLDAWQPLLAEWPRPVLNQPQAIARVARDVAASLLAKLPGVAMPPTLRVDRSRLHVLAEGGVINQDWAAGITFPLIVRPLDSHAGRDLYKVDSPIALAGILAVLAGDAFFVSPFIDYRSSDGLFRKYRVILVDGQAFACHMGISDHWMIHYLNAGMADSQAKRDEEAAFMASFDSTFAVRHAAALAAINQQIGLDYLGIDCAETPDGRLLVFEVDHAMVVHAMDPIDTYPYKPAVINRIFAAFRSLLIRAAEKNDRHV